jgi:hypothetical protein
MSLLLGFAWMIIVILFVFWLIGLILHIGGALIHLVLVVAIVLVICRVLFDRRA